MCLAFIIEATEDLFQSIDGVVLDIMTEGLELRDSVPDERQNQGETDLKIHPGIRARH